MNLRIWAAPTLKSFSEAITLGLIQAGFRIVDDDSCVYALIQIHGSPAARTEDESILDETRSLKITKAYLIHRPDEMLRNSRLVSYFENDSKAKFIFLGDLIFRFPFWKARREASKVIPHPCLDISMPAVSEKLIVGSYTSWGEMRHVHHYLSLVDTLKDSDLFDFKIGGSGLDKNVIPSHVEVSDQYFVPHFNVQLYHLLGSKRYGESSGSLHRGISIPVIFEANGAERLEGFTAIKIEADDGLKNIDFAKAAFEMKKLAGRGIDSELSFNLRIAKNNSAYSFAKSVRNFLVD